MTISFTGKYPNLCSGVLSVFVDGKQWVFEKYALESGGICNWDYDKHEQTTEEGAWEIAKWPSGFPETLKKDVLDLVNNQIPHGCCGGCE